MYVCMYVRMYVCVYVHMYVRTYVCMYVCMYVVDGQTGVFCGKMNFTTDDTPVLLLIDF